MRANQLYNRLYRVGAHLIFTTLVPFCVLCFLTLWIVFHLERQPVLQIMQESVRLIRCRASNKSAKILALLGAKFLLSRVLPTVINLFEAVWGNAYVNMKHVNIVITTSNFLVMLNSATNFCVYFAFSRVFRRNFAGIVFKIITCCRPVEFNRRMTDNSFSPSNSFRSYSVNSFRSYSVRREISVSRNSDIVLHEVNNQKNSNCLEVPSRSKSWKL